VYDAAVVRLKDTKGLRYLEALLRHPGRAFHVAELLEMVAGRPPAGDRNTEAIERARKAGTNRVRQALARVRGAHEALGLHPHNAVHTGTYCTYTPDRPIRWSE